MTSPTRTQSFSDLDPFDRTPGIVDDRGLTQAVGMLLDRSKHPPIDADEMASAATFGQAIMEMRWQTGLSRLELAEKARMSPVYLVLLESGLLAPNAIPLAVVALLALALERPLDEWPLLPWADDDRSASAGLDVVTQVVGALLSRPGQSSSTRGSLGAQEQEDVAAHLTLEVALVKHDGRIDTVGGSMLPRPSGWSVDVLVRDATTERPLRCAEIAVCLEGTDLGFSSTDTGGRAHFDSIDRGPAPMFIMDLPAPAQATPPPKAAGNWPADIQYCWRLAHLAEEGLKGPDQANIVALVDEQRGGIANTLQWLYDQCEAAHGLQMALALQRYWVARGPVRQSRDWLTSFLHLEEAIGRESALETRARAMRAASTLSRYLSEYDEAEDLARRSQDAYRALGGESGQRGIAHSLNALAIVARYKGDADQATDLARESLSVYPGVEDDDLRGIAIAYNTLAAVARDQERYDQASEFAKQNLSFAQEAHDVRTISHAWNVLGFIASAQSGAMHGEEERISLARAAWYQARALLTTEPGVSDYWLATQCLIGLAAVFCRQHDPDAAERAATLQGLVTALLDALKGARMPPVFQDEYDKTARVVQGILGEQAYKEAWTGGRSLSITQAVAACRRLINDLQQVYGGAKLHSPSRATEERWELVKGARAQLYRQLPSKLAFPPPDPSRR